MTYDIEHWLSYIASMEVFLLASLYIVSQYKYERRACLSGYAYPSPGLLFATSIYCFFIIPGIILWNNELIGEAFRERFGYGTEYYLQAMIAGLISIFFGYSGFKTTYFYRKTNTLQASNLIVKTHNYILKSKSAFWLAFIISIAGLFFSTSLGELSSVGYGDGNYAEKLADPKVKIVGLLIDILAPAISVMWYLAVFKSKRPFLIITTLLTIFFLVFGLGKASLFGILGYLLPVVCIFFYRNMLPGLRGKVKRISVLRVISIVVAVLLISLVSKAATRMLVNFGVARNLFDMFMNLDLLLAESDLVLTLIWHSIEGLLKEISAVDIISLINTRQATGIQPEYGGTYLLLIYSLLPSLLVPEKPETTLATWYADNYWFTQSEVLEYGAGVQANIFHIVGEVYINFGQASLLVIPIILFVYGSALGVLVKLMLRPSGMYLPIYVLLVRILHEVVMTVTTIAAVFSSVVKQFIIASIFIALFISLIKVIGLFQFFVPRKIFIVPDHE